MIQYDNGATFQRWFSKKERSFVTLCIPDEERWQLLLRVLGKVSTCSSGAEPRLKKKSVEKLLLNLAQDLVRLRLWEDATPVHLRPRPVAIALQEQIDEESDRLLQNGTLKQIEFAEWTTPIVVVKKPNGSIRVCADYSTIFLFRFLHSQYNKLHVSTCAWENCHFNVYKVKYLKKKRAWKRIRRAFLS